MAKRISAKRWARALHRAAERINYPARGPRGSKENRVRQLQAGRLVAEAQYLIRWKLV